MYSTVNATSIIAVNNSKKYYGKMSIFDHLSFTINKGTNTGLIGPIGAGKTTLFKCLLGFTDISYGEINLYGVEVNKNGIVNDKNLSYCRKYIGYVPEETTFYEFLSPREYLEMIGTALKLPKEMQEFRTQRLLSMLKLERYSEQLITTLSKGNRQKLSIAAGLVQNPQLLLLDEPHNGLDPSGRYYFFKLLSEFSQKDSSELFTGGPGTVFISSHLLADIERICTNVIIIDYVGQIVAQGPISDVKSKLREDASLEEVYLAVVEGWDEEKIDEYYQKESKEKDKLI